MNRERFDVHFTVTASDLLQANAHYHALVAGVDDIQHGITDAGFELTVQTFITRAARGSRFRGVTEVQQRQIGNQRRDKRCHRGGFTRTVPPGERCHQLIQIKGSGKETVPVNQRQ
ncbi:hypothetical protein D3C72_1839570 [compost metagenome]